MTLWERDLDLLLRFVLFGVNDDFDFDFDFYLDYLDLEFYDLLDETSDIFGTVLIFLTFKLFIFLVYFILYF